MRYTDRFSLRPGGTPVATDVPVQLRRRTDGGIVDTAYPDAAGFVTFDISQALDGAADATLNHNAYYATVTVGAETRSVYSEASGWVGNIGAEDLRDALFSFRTGYLAPAGTAAADAPGYLAPSANMICAIAPGAVLHAGAVIHFPAAETATFAAADATHPRIDLVVLRTYRAGSAAGDRVYAGWYVKTGTPAASPVDPTLTSSATISETALARVTIPAGATAITAGMIANLLGPALSSLLDVAEADGTVISSDTTQLRVSGAFLLTADSSSEAYLEIDEEYLQDFADATHGGEGVNSTILSADGTAVSPAEGGVALGDQAVVNGINGIAIGLGAATAQANQAVIYNDELYVASRSLAGSVLKLNSPDMAEREIAVDNRGHILQPHGAVEVVGENLWSGSFGTTTAGFEASLATVTLDLVTGVDYMLEMWAMIVTKGNGATADGQIHIVGTTLAEDFRHIDGNFGLKSNTDFQMTMMRRQRYLAGLIDPTIKVVFKHISGSAMTHRAYISVLARPIAD